MTINLCSGVQGETLAGIGRNDGGRLLAASTAPVTTMGQGSSSPVRTSPIIPEVPYGGSLHNCNDRSEPQQEVNNSSMRIYSTRQESSLNQENLVSSRLSRASGGSCSHCGQLMVNCSCNFASVAIYGSTSTSSHLEHHQAPVVVTPPRSLLPHQDETGCLTPSDGCPSSNNGGCGHWCDACRVKAQVDVEGSAGQLETRPTPTRSSRLRNLTFPKRHRHKTKNPTSDTTAQAKKKKTPWPFRLNCRLRPTKAESEPEPSSPVGCGACMCPSMRRQDAECHPQVQQQQQQIGHNQRHPSGDSIGLVGGSNCSLTASVALRAPAPVIDLARFNPEQYPIEDWEDRARQERAREMQEGIEPPPGFSPVHFPVIHYHSQNPHNHPQQQTVHQLQQQQQLQLQQQQQLLSAGSSLNIPLHYNSMVELRALLERLPRLGLSGPMSPAALTEETLLQHMGRWAGDGSLIQRTVHTQVDYIHCLVPDLLSITNCAFYWGVMDRYEAERLLDNRPEGTFLLRDSAQEEYLFSVSFRRYGRSLHARIEHWNHKFSFDSHDPGVFASDTVCGLIEHYKDPSCCMFFEPMLTNPLARTNPFPLQHLCRAVISSSTTYDGINHLCLPKSLKIYLKEYHYKQKIRVRRLDH